MPPSQRSNRNWKETLRARLLAEPRKAAVLGGLLLLLLVLAGKTFLSRTPSSASASPAMAAGAATPDLSAALLQRGPENPRLERHLSLLDRRVRRDPFAVQYAAYPLVEPPAAEQTVSVDAYLTRVQEQLAADAQARAERQARAQAVRELAKGLRLQSTIISARPVAVLNDQIVSVGDTIAGLRVVRITQGQCVLAQGEVEVTLSME